MRALVDAEIAEGDDGRVALRVERTKSSLPLLRREGGGRLARGGDRNGVECLSAGVRATPSSSSMSAGCRLRIDPPGTI